MVIAACQFFYQFRARHLLDIRKARYLYLRQRVTFVFRYQLPQLRGIPQDTRLLHLADYLSQANLTDFKPVSFQRIGKKRRTQFLPHRRKLRRIPHQQKTTPLPRIDKLYQVIQQTSRTEHAAGQAFVGNHGSFVHYKQGVCSKIVIYGEISKLVGIGPLPVYLLMNGESGMACIRRKNFCGTSRRSQQYRLLLQLIHRFHQCSDQRCLTGTGVTSQDKNFIRQSRQQEL